MASAVTSPVNVVELFLDAARQAPARTAFVTAAGARISFAALREQVERFAGGLTTLGFLPGERAVFMLGMSPELYVAVLGTLAAGGVAVFVDPWVSIRDIGRL